MFYASFAHATSVSQGRSSPRQLSMSVGRVPLKNRRAAVVTQRVSGALETLSHTRDSWVQIWGEGGKVNAAFLDTPLRSGSAFTWRACRAFAGANSSTVTEKNVTESFTGVVPCAGGSADVTLTYNTVFHITELDNGTYHLTGTLAGTVTAVADGITYTGRVTQWFGENQNTMNSEGTVTFILRLTGTDGSRITFSAVFHYTITATGVETSFDKPLCH